MDHSKSDGQCSAAIGGGIVEVLIEEIIASTLGDHACGDQRYKQAVVKDMFSHDLLDIRETSFLQEVTRASIGII